MMVITKSRIHQLFLLTLAICCLTTAVNCGKITTKTKTKAVTETGDDVTTTTTAKSEVAAANTDAGDGEHDSGEDDDDDDDAAEKNAVQSSDESLFSVWGIVRGVLNWIKDDISAGLFGADDDVAAEGRSDGSVQGRTFGKIRRLQMALIPIIFKFGVLTAMVAFLVGIGLKTLFLVKVLLAMNALALLAKFFTLKANILPQIQYSAPPPSWNHHVEYSAAPSWGWSPSSSAGWSSAPVHEHEHHSEHPSKEIHLHIHGAASQPKADTYTAYVASPSPATGNSWQRSDPYSAYEPVSHQTGNDLTVDATQSMP
ncbi:uncharacterized protein LOC133334217, partial [Musca vetustissima]|uniref:uncharacterized protein LOC133334217 n=1 Tax=Musca vetustissima TaxID=27455 RepID=UPI002AB72DE9